MQKKTWWGGEKQRLGSLCAWQSANVAIGHVVWWLPDQCCLFTSKVQSPGVTCINNPGLRQKCSMLEGEKALPVHFVLSFKSCFHSASLPAFEVQWWVWGRQVWADLLSIKDGQTRRLSGLVRFFLLFTMADEKNHDWSSLRCWDTCVTICCAYTPKNKTDYPDRRWGRGTELSSGTLCTLKEQQPLLGW